MGLEQPSADPAHPEDESGSSSSRLTPQGPEFAPVDPWDGRKPFEWQSRWDDEARKAMRVEIAYVVLILVFCPVALFLFGTGKLEDPLRLTPSDSRSLTLYGCAWIGGLLGGCVFSIKWLYHTIARGKWHLDRRPWRFLTPLMSGALGFATLSLLISGVLPIFNEKITESPGGITGVAFIVGYFSDNTVAALAAAADRVLGTKTALRDRR